jgi:hypothetical protein
MICSLMLQASYAAAYHYVNPSCFMTMTKAIVYSILFIISLMCTSCEGARRTASLKAQYKDIYIGLFKMTYFRQLLTKSYNNSNAVQEIIRGDHSGFTEPILTMDDYKLIDSLTTIDNQLLVLDSAEGHRRAEGAQGKRPLGYIMEKLAGKWLDSLAKRRWKVSGVSSYLID